MKSRIYKIAGLLLTILFWIWASQAHHRSAIRNLLLVWCGPFLQYAIVSLGRRRLDAHPSKASAERINIVVHYAMMIALGIAIFPAIHLVREQFYDPDRTVLPIPEMVGVVLLWITEFLTLLTVINLAVRGLGAPFAAKLSSRLATDWMYAWTRNPMLLCTLALLVSVGMRYRSIWFVCWTLLIVAPGWLYFVWRYEERELEIRFGASYLDYRARTPFLWPRRARAMKVQPAQELVECDQDHVRP
jgi:protein-S-isoprenylcysteine O-methyltransferase Ste14